MNKLLIYLLLILPLFVEGQAVDNPRVKIRAANSNAVLYEANSDTPKGTYPATVAGRTQFQIDIKNGLWNLTLDNGAIIPKGMKPPNVMPVPSGLIGPSWASLRYTMTGDELYVEGAGSELAKLQFKRVDGTKITGTNPNGVNVNDVDFFGFGSNDDATFNKQWKVTFSPSIIGKAFRITAQKNDGTLFVKEFSPVASASKTILYLAPGSTTTPPTSTTSTIAYDQSIESESATLSNSGQDVFTFDDGGSSGSKIACCFSNASTYIDYTLPSIAGTGSLTLELRYQTNTGDPATASITAGGQTKSLSLAGTSGGKSTATISVPVVTGNNTIRIAGASGTFLQDKIRLSGSINVVTNGSGGNGGNGNVTTTYPSFTRIVGVGNSIWTHSASTALNWSNNNGMAASAPDKDMAHLIWSALKTVNPNVTLSIMGQGSGLELGYNSSDKDAVKNNLVNLNDNLAQQNGANATYDLILLMIGENTSDNGFDETKFRSMLDQLFASIKTNGSPTVVLRNSFWDGNSQANAVLKAYASEKGYKFANMDDIRERSDYKASQYSNAGVAHHPNDAGHAAMAERVLAQLRTTTTTQPPSTTTTGPTTTVGAGQGLYALNSTYTALSESGGRPAYAEPSWITNGTLRLGLTPTAGDVLTHMQIGSSQSVVNNPIFTNNNKLDVGRQFMDAAYSFPDGSGGSGNEGPYIDPSGQRTDQYKGGPPNGSIGWNPVQGGDEAYKGTGTPNPNSSPVLTHYTDGSKAYYKTQPLQWDLNNIAGKMYMEGWLTFDPNNSRAFRWHRRWTMFRDDQHINEFQTSRQQEAPCMYTTPHYRKYYYCTGQPYTNADLTEQNVVANPNLQQQPVWSTEPFVFSVNPDDGKTIVLLAHNARFTFGRFVNAAYAGGEPGWENPAGFDAGYLNSAPQMHLDADGVYDLDAAIGYFNSLSEARTWAYAQPRWDGLPEYRFDQVSKTRMGFWLHHAQDQREKNMSGSLDVQPIQLPRANNGLDMKIVMPEKWVNGRVVKHLYVKAAITSSTNQFWINWRKAGDPNDYHKVITLANDGVDHVTDIDMSGESNWSDKDIVQVSFSHVYTNSWPSVANDVWKIKYISYRNLN